MLIYLDCKKGVYDHLITAMGGGVSFHIFKIFSENGRSSHRRCSIKNVVVKKFRNVHRETPVLESLLNKIAALLKRNSNTGVFS